MEVKMASNKIKALALTSGIAMAAMIGSTTLAEARYCRAHYGWHRHCVTNYCRPSYYGYYRPTYWGYRPVASCWRPRCGWYGANWPGYYGYGGYGGGYWGYGGALGAGAGLLGAGLFGIF
jgi:hypothetical protein